MRVLIVGCGYVGLPLGSELAAQGYEVFGLRRSGAAALRAAGIRPLPGDITRPDDLAGLPRDYEWVVNCVSSGGGTAEEYRRVYLDGTRNLLEWLRPAPPAKYVYTSSTGVYGQDDGSTVDETSATEPVTESARVLVQTERTLLAAAREHDFPAVVLRVAGIYGPDRGYWLREFVNGQARIEGAGSRVLNMIHRDDVMGCILAALRLGRRGEIYNAVDNEPVTDEEFFRWLAGQLRRPLPPQAPAGVPAHRRGSTNKRVTNGKLRTELGYRFRYPTFREGYAAQLREVLAGKPGAAI